MATSLAEFIAALEQTWTGLVTAVEDLTPGQWDTATELPGWSAKDIVSHIVGVELTLLGEPLPEHPLPDGLAHVRNDVGRWVEVPVDLRRPVPGEAVLAELRDVTGRRLQALRALDEAALEDTVPGIMGAPMKQKHLLGLRVFDSWIHEQDVRRALGRPGGLDNAAAAVSRRRLLLAMAALPVGAGRTLVYATTSPDTVATLAFGQGYRDVDTPDADARVESDFETFVRLGAGRVGRADAGVTVTGDEALAEEFLRAMVITP